MIFHNAGNIFLQLWSSKNKKKKNLNQMAGWWKQLNSHFQKLESQALILQVSLVELLILMSTLHVTGSKLK